MCVGVARSQVYRLCRLAEGPPQGGMPDVEQRVATAEAMDPGDTYPSQDGNEVASPGGPRCAVCGWERIWAGEGDATRGLTSRTPVL